MSAADAASIWLWARDTSRWAQLAESCIAPKALLAVAAPAPASGSTIINHLIVRDTIMTMLRELSPDTVYVEEPCDGLNAFYTIETDTLKVCSEILDYADEAGLPMLPIAVVAHELGHAIIHKMHLPITGSEEEAADEFSFVYLLSTGRSQDELSVQEIAWFYFTHKAPEDLIEEHPSSTWRASEAYCMLRGKQDPVVNPICFSRLQRARRNWAMLLAGN